MGSANVMHDAVRDSAAALHDAVKVADQKFNDLKENTVKQFEKTKVITIRTLYGSSAWVSYKTIIISLDPFSKCHTPGFLQHTHYVTIF